MQTMQIAYAVDAELDQMKFKLKMFAIHSFFWASKVSGQQHK